MPYDKSGKRIPGSYGGHSKAGSPRRAGEDKAHKEGVSEGMYVPPHILSARKKAARGLMKKGEK